MTLNKQCRVGVIGAGYLGKFHAEKYANLSTAELVAVCDTHEAARHLVASHWGAEAISDYRELIGKVEAVSIVTPTTLHHEIALFFLNHGVHVLVEKPITVTLVEAQELVKAAQEKQLILQVGHLEQFNPVIQALKPLVRTPRLIEAFRLAPFTPRGADVNVVLDLMIHDIELVQSMVRAPIESISASGMPVITADIDVANARLNFSNGAVAYLTASRVHESLEREMTVFQEDGFISLDLQSKQWVHHKTMEEESYPGVKKIVREKQQFDRGDALKSQIVAFLDAILHQQSVLVSGEAGQQALATAIAITDIIRSNQMTFA